MQTSRIALSALAISASAACQPPDAEPASASAAPVVGRLITRDGVIDLNVHAFADAHGPVPTGSYARLMADVDKGSATDARTRNQAPHPGARAPASDEDETESGNFLRRSY